MSSAERFWLFAAAGSTAPDHPRASQAPGHNETSAEPASGTYPTGLAGLDGVLGGGVPSGVTLLVLADASNGPLVFLEQFAAAGLMAGDRVYYYGIGRPEREVTHRVRRYLTGSPAVEGFEYLDYYNLQFPEMETPSRNLLGLEAAGPTMDKDVAPRILRHPAERPFRVVVDTLSDAILTLGVEATTAMATRLVAMVKARGGTALMYLTKGLHEPRLEKRFLHLADGIIDFSTDGDGSRVRSHFRLLKMRGVPTPPRAFQYDLRREGIRVETTKRV